MRENPHIALQKWWGYRHESGSVQAKPFFNQADLDDAYESPFVVQVVEPFDCDGREQALEIVTERTKS